MNTRMSRKRGVELVGKGLQRRALPAHIRQQHGGGRKEPIPVLGCKAPFDV